MRLIGLSKIMKLKRKNIGNQRLCEAIDSWLADMENFEGSEQMIHAWRPDANKVHNDGFYFFDIHLHRTLILIEWVDNTEGTILWVGSHQEYETTFKNNKDSIEKWLRYRQYIH